MNLDRLFISSFNSNVLYHRIVCNKQHVYCNNNINCINCNGKLVKKTLTQMFNVTVNKHYDHAFVLIT
jgi:hypothetical protein